MKKLLFGLISTLFFAPLIAAAVQITVPSAPGSNYVLLSTTTGAYVYVATSSLGILGGGGSTFATTSVSAIWPLAWNTTTASMSVATSSGSSAGVLSAADWTTFNGKLSTVTADSPLSGSGTSASHLVLSTAGTWSGVAGTATALATARAINGVNFDGTGPITITAASSTLLANNNTWSGTNAFGVFSGTKLGLASTTPFYMLSVGTAGTTYGSIMGTENTLATTTSMTVDWTAGNQQLIQMGTVGIAVAFSNALPGATLRLVVCNPIATAGALTFTGVEWVNNTVPVQTTTANQCDIYSFLSTAATSTNKIFGSQAPGFR